MAVVLDRSLTITYVIHVKISYPKYTFKENCPEQTMIIVIIIMLTHGITISGRISKPTKRSAKTYP